MWKRAMHHSRLLKHVDRGENQLLCASLNRLASSRIGSSAIAAHTSQQPTPKCYHHSNRCDPLFAPKHTQKNPQQLTFDMRNARFYSTTTVGRQQAMDIEQSSTLRGSVDPLPPSSKSLSSSKMDEDEEKNARLLFNQVIQELIQENHGKPLLFPKEIIFLLGAPGSGKGTMTHYIQKSRGLTAKPIVCSDILDAPEYRAIKERGELIGDGVVLRALFKELLKSENEMGVIVDGFPRTEIQARALSCLWDWMQEQREKHGRVFRRPKFRITVLYIPEELSVQRQLARGKQALEHNERVNQTGLGHVIEVRPTDMSIDYAKSRYKYFKDHIWKSVKLLKPKFNYNFIDATGVKQQVAENVKNEMKYQSSLELGKETFDMITKFPTAERLTQHARQSLVRRLDTYALEHTTLFKQVLDVLQNEFLHIMQRQSLTGAAIIRTQNPLLNQKLAVEMLLDILLERGYKVYVLLHELHSLPFQSIDTDRSHR